ncbi:Translocator protein [Grifola frondosa]|uniref:Translocator protein n=1 Tax=Grifola frondosa TaxID=5627 RepID=A0A1C7M0I9_GRIFR|nr:Translocator protein [Grifola frondosa]
MSVIYLPNILLEIPRNSITAVGLPLVAGFLSGYPTGKVCKGQWYKSLTFPPGLPPRQVFPIVWGSLYFAMGYASHLAVKAFDESLTTARKSPTSIALTLYYAQLALNLAWSPLFFFKKQVGLALIDMGLLTGTTMYMTALLHEPTGGKSTYLLLPYCAWLSYATYINAVDTGLQSNRGDVLYKSGCKGSPCGAE